VYIIFLYPVGFIGCHLGVAPFSPTSIVASVYRRKIPMNNRGRCSRVIRIELCSGGERRRLGRRDVFEFITSTRFRMPQTVYLPISHRRRASRHSTSRIRGTQIHHANCIASSSRSLVLSEATLAKALNALSRRVVRRNWGDGTSVCSTKMPFRADCRTSLGQTRFTHSNLKARRTEKREDRGRVRIRTVGSICGA